MLRLLLIDVLGAAGVVVTASVAARAAGRDQRDSIRALADQIQSWRDNPAPSTLTQQSPTVLITPELQPLLARYEPEALEPLSAALQSDGPSVLEVVTSLGARLHECTGHVPSLVRCTNRSFCCSAATFRGRLERS